MANAFPSLQLHRILPPTALNLPSAAAKSWFLRPSTPLFSFPCPLSPHIPRASSDPTPGETPDAGGEESAAQDADFESRLSQVRLKYRSGTGKKAEQRRAKKIPGGAGAGAAPSSTKGGKVMLPPVPLREPVSAGGMKVEFGFSPYSEWLNGRLAMLGLAALLLVELGSGKGLLSYHSSSIIFIQIYTVAAAGSLFVKFEKEKVSVWPKAPPPAPKVGE